MTQFGTLCKLVGVDNYTELIDEEAEMFLNESEDKSSEALILSNDGLPHIETHLQLAHAEMINEYQEKLNDDPEHACVSCHRLLAKSSVTKFKYTSEKFKSETWKRFKKFMVHNDPDVRDKTLYVCQYCNIRLNRNELPNRCILNGLLTKPIPEAVKHKLWAFTEPAVLIQQTGFNIFTECQFNFSWMVLTKLSGRKECRKVHYI